MSEERSPFDEGEPAPPEPTQAQADALPYTDLDTIKFGKYRGQILQEVPASYLLWLWTQRPLTDHRLQLYIKQNIRALAKECPDFALNRSDLED